MKFILPVIILLLLGISLSYLVPAYADNTWTQLTRSTSGTDNMEVDSNGSAIIGCNSPYSKTTTSAPRINLPVSGTAQGCSEIAPYWNISTIPSNATIRGITLTFNSSSVTNGLNCDYKSILRSPLNETASDLWNDIRNGTIFVTNDNKCSSGLANTKINLGQQAMTDLQNFLSQHKLTWSVGISYPTVTRDNQLHRSNFGNFLLSVNYTTTPINFSKPLTDAISISSSILTSKTTPIQKIPFNPYYEVYKNNGYTVGQIKDGILYNLTSSSTNDQNVILGMIDYVKSKGGGYILVDGYFDMQGNNMTIPDNVTVEGMTVGESIGSATTFNFVNNGGMIINSANSLPNISIQCSDPTTVPCLTVQGGYDHFPTMWINARDRLTAVKWGAGFTQGSTAGSNAESLTIIGGRTGIDVYNATQNNFPNIIMTGFSTCGISFENSDHNHFANTFMSSSDTSHGTPKDLCFGSGPNDLTLGNTFQTLTVPPTDITVQINTNSYGGCRPNYIQVLELDGVPTYQYTSTGYCDVVVKSTTNPYYQGFQNNWTPSLPTLNQVITNKNPYLMTIYQAGGTGEKIIGFTGGNGVQGRTTNIGNQPMFQLNPGESIFFSGTVPTSWVWYANN